MKVRHIASVDHAILLAAVLVCFGCVGPSAPIPSADTPQNRRAAANRYIKAVHIDEMLKQNAQELAQALPEKDRERFVRFMMAEIQTNTIHNAMASALVRHFTPAEIDALAKFNASPEGEAITRNMASYMADSVPPIQAEITRVMSLTNSHNAALQWDTRLKESKVLPDSKTVTADFTCVNVGDKAVNIKSVNAAPDCDVDGLSKKVYKPGEKGTFSVKFLIGDHVGLYLNIITIETDDPAEPTVTLQMRVEIPEYMRISPRFVFWKVGDKPEPRIIHVSIPPEYQVQVSKVETQSTNFQCRLVQTDSKTNFDISILPLSTGNPGNGKLTLKAMVDSATPRDFDVFMRIVPVQAGKEKESGWGDRIVWLDARSKADYDKSHLQNALLLNQVEWNKYIENVINTWSPGTRIVVYCLKGCRSSSVADRLVQEYGLPDVFYIVKSQ